MLEGRNAIKETWQQSLSRTLRSTSWVDPASIKVISRTAIPVMMLKTIAPAAAATAAATTTSATGITAAASTTANAKEGTNGGGGDDDDDDDDDDDGEKAGGGAVASTTAAAPRPLPPPAVPTVSLDISFEGSTHNGVASCHYVASRLTELPAIRPLVLVLKQCLSERSLSASYTGGLSSYALFLMVARYVEESRSADVGSLLMGFLDFYGNCFDPRTCGISLNRRCYFNRTGHPASSISGGGGNASSSSSLSGGGSGGGGGGRVALGHFPPQFDPLYIEDPLCEGNNAGRNCFRIYLIQRIWSDALKALTQAIDQDIPDGSLLDAITSSHFNTTSAAAVD